MCSTTMEEIRHQYDQEFKKNAVELCRTSGKSASQVARELGINSSMLTRWKMQQESFGERAFPGAGKLMQGTDRAFSATQGFFGFGKLFVSPY